MEELHMKIKKYQKLKSNKYKVTLDNDDTITLYDEVILDNNLLLTKEIDNIDDILNQNNYYEAYFLSIKYITKKQRTKKEIFNYLLKKYDIEIINNVILKLEKDNYLNEDLYINSYINDQVNLSNNGYYKILRDLKNNGIDEDIIKKYLDTIDKEVWIEKANKIINKSLKSNNKYSSKYLKDKLLYDLSSKGYDNNDILELINNIDIKDDIKVLEKNYKLLYNKLSKKYKDKELELQLFNKLMAKGFNYSDVKEIINKK